MRNKLRRTKTRQDALCPSKDTVRATEVITLVLSDDDTSLEKDTQGSKSSSSKVQPLQKKKKKPCCAEDIKIAPIFLHTAQRSKCERSSDGGLDQPAEELQKSVLPLQSDDSQLVRGHLSTPAVSHLTEKKLSWRRQLSPSALLSCLEEIQTSNPAFPVQTVFGALQSKGFSSSAESPSYSRQNQFKEKRKRGNDISQKASKRLRSSLFTEGIIDTSYCLLSVPGVQESAVLSVKKQPRRSRLSRSHRLKQQSESVGLVNIYDTNQTESDRQSVITCGILQRDSSFEDVLWADKYSPQHSSEVIGNSASVNKLHSWLKKWKLRADCDERGKKEARKHEENRSGSDSWDCGDFQGEAGAEHNTVEPLSNTMLITGPSGKSVAPKNVISSSKQRPAQNPGRKGKTNAASVTLANYFKMKAKTDHSHVGGLSPSEKPDGKKLNNSSPGSDQTVPPNKKTAISLILFEEMDVCSYLQLVCLAENVKLQLDDVIRLLTVTRGDVRRCLLQLQLWVNSGAGRAFQSEEPTCLHYSKVIGEDSLGSQLPPCDRGCTASLLGLHTATQNHLLNLLKSSSDPDMIELLKLLAESWRRNVPLLYCNLELLLPIRTKGTSVHYLEKVTSSGQQSELAPSDVQLDGNVNPKATAANSNSIRNISRLSRRKYTSAVFNATSSFNLTEKPQRTLLSSKAAHLRAPSSDDKTEQNADKVTADRLHALTNFFDLMSYLNATMLLAGPLISGSCRPEFVWTGAEIKDSLLDEMREEEVGGSCCQDRLLDIQAAVEGLGFRKCWRQMSESWPEAQKYRQELGGTRWGSLVERLTRPVSANSESLGYSFQPFCTPSVSQKRYKLSRMVLGSRSFSLLGNRQAVSVDYMPVLRSICRSQRALQQREEPVRCLNYLSSKHLDLSKSTLQLLAENFS
ncbi:hypothetical protein PAMA_016149 [Pampus argenteus]